MSILLLIPILFITFIGVVSLVVIIKVKTIEKNRPIYLDQLQQLEDVLKKYKKI
jgi:hypothetical protein